MYIHPEPHNLKCHVPGSAWEPPSVPPALIAFVEVVTAALAACYDARPVRSTNSPMIMPIAVSVTLGNHAGSCVGDTVCWHVLQAWLALW
jgi:hypothetical protein